MGDGWEWLKTEYLAGFDISSFGLSGAIAIELAAIFIQTSIS
jgi:hypothetical protein